MMNTGCILTDRLKNQYNIFKKVLSTFCHYLPNFVKTRMFWQIYFIYIKSTLVMATGFCLQMHCREVGLYPVLGYVTVEQYWTPSQLPAPDVAHKEHPVWQVTTAMATTQQQHLNKMLVNSQIVIQFCKRLNSLKSRYWKPSSFTDQCTVWWPCCSQVPSRQSDHSRLYCHTCLNLSLYTLYIPSGTLQRYRHTRRYYHDVFMVLSWCDNKECSCMKI